MKYPTFNKQKIDFIHKKKFDFLLKSITEQISFDNQENKLGLQKDDIELLAWNSATVLLLHL